MNLDYWIDRAKALKAAIAGQGSETKGGATSRMNRSRRDPTLGRPPK